MQWTAQRFPGLDRQIRGLAKQHSALRDEPLHLAIAYDPGRETGDVFLFELLGNFGGNEINDDAKFFEVTFDSSPSFALAKGQKLHLVLTNPPELRVALDQHWPTAEEVRHALRRGDFEVLHSDDVGREALELLKEQPSRLAKPSKTGNQTANARPEPSNERASSMAATGAKRQGKRRTRP